MNLEKEKEQYGSIEAPVELKMKIMIAAGREKAFLSKTFVFCASLLYAV